MKPNARIIIIVGIILALVVSVLGLTNRDNGSSIPPPTSAFAQTVSAGGSATCGEPLHADVIEGPAAEFTYMFDGFTQTFTTAGNMDIYFYFNVEGQVRPAGMSTSSFSVEGCERDYQIAVDEYYCIGEAIDAQSGNDVVTVEICQMIRPSTTIEVQILDDSEMGFSRALDMQIVECGARITTIPLRNNIVINSLLWFPPDGNQIEVITDEVITLEQHGFHHFSTEDNTFALWVECDGA